METILAIIVLCVAIYIADRFDRKHRKQNQDDVIEKHKRGRYPEYDEHLNEFIRRNPREPYRGGYNPQFEEEE
jgi:hypothetical protein